MTLTSRPSMTDDTGAGDNGTEVDKDFIDGVFDEIDDQVHSITNTLIKPKNTTDEVVNARGSMGSLDARLDVSLTEAGAIRGDLAGIAYKTELNSALGSVNLVANDTFLLWPAGDAAAPSHWTLVTGTIARVGSGLGDTNRKHGKFAVKGTASAGTAFVLEQNLLDTGVFPDATLKTRKISIGARVETNTASKARVRIDDGVGTTDSSFHSGSGAGGPESDGWEWLTATHTISGTATKLAIQLRVESGSAVDGYFSGITVILSDLMSNDWIPAPTYLQQYALGVDDIGSDLATGATKIVASFPLPGLITHVQFHHADPGTAGTTTVDVNTWNGAAYVSIFATPPGVAAPGAHAGKAPDSATYSTRCVTFMSGATPAAGGALSVDIDALQNTGAPNTLFVYVTVLHYARPLQQLLAYNDIV